MISVRSNDGSTDLGTSAGWLLKATLICADQWHWPQPRRFAEEIRANQESEVCGMCAAFSNSIKYIIALRVSFLIMALAAVFLRRASARVTQ
jgi:hypothetical protein